MKKQILLLALCMIFCLVGCKKDKPANSAADTDSIQAASTVNEDEKNAKAGEIDEENFDPVADDCRECENYEGAMDGAFEEYSFNNYARKKYLLGNVTSSEKWNPTSFAAPSTTFSSALDLTQQFKEKLGLVCENANDSDIIKIGNDIIVRAFACLPSDESKRIKIAEECIVKPDTEVGKNNNLEMSVYITISNKKDNVVRVYDNININNNKLITYYSTCFVERMDLAHYQNVEMGNAGLVKSSEHQLLWISFRKSTLEETLPGEEEEYPYGEIMGDMYSCFFDAADYRFINCVDDKQEIVDMYSKCYENGDCSSDQNE